MRARHVTLYRGENAGGPPIVGGISPGCLFATPYRDVAELYGETISVLRIDPDARILVEGTAAFATVTGRRRGELIRTMRSGETLRSAADHAVSKAEAAGYDAVEFTSMRDMGVAIIRRDIVMSSEVENDRAEGDAALAEAAEFFYEAEELYEDGDLDPDDHVAVLQRAFVSGACDDFAHVLRLMTGWQTVRAVFAAPGIGMGHHTLVRDPDGRLLDATGWTTEAALRRRYVGRRKEATIAISEGHPISTSMESDEDLQRIASVVRAFEHEPFGNPSFRRLSARPISDPDLPTFDDEPDTPAP